MDEFNFLRNRIQSFRNAFRGLRDILTTEHNAWVHAACTVIVLLLSVWLQIDTVEFIFIIIFICMVWITEAINTVLEIVIDIVSPRFSQPAKRAKDIAATAVLFASLGAFIAGCVILVPTFLIKFGLN